VPSAEWRLDTALQCLGSVHGIRLKRHGHLALSSTDTGPHFPIHGNGTPSSTHLSESSFTSADNLCSSDRMEAWSGGCKAHSMSARCPCADFCSAVPLGHIKETQPLVRPCLNFREAIGCQVSRKIPVDTSLADEGMQVVNGLAKVHCIHTCTTNFATHVAKTKKRNEKWVSSAIYQYIGLIWGNLQPWPSRPTLFTVTGISPSVGLGAVGTTSMPIYKTISYFKMCSRAALLVERLCCVPDKLSECLPAFP
jgi:hypothetical protein